MKMASNPQQMLPRNPYGRIRMTEFVIGGGKQFDKTRRGETTNEEITMYVSSKKSAMFFVVRESLENSALGIALEVTSGLATVSENGGTGLVSGERGYSAAFCL